MSAVHPHPPTTCPHCGRHGDRATGTNTDDRPEPECVSVCFGCEGVSLYTDTLQLRKPTPEEAEELKGPKFGPMVRKAVATVRTAKRGKR